MLKLLKAAHIGLVLLMLLHTGNQLAWLAEKVLYPNNENVRYWKPGAEMGVIALAFVALLGILACSTGLLKARTWHIPAIAHGIWLVCLTWLGWFSPYAYFRLQELVGVDLGDPSAVRRAETLHTMQAMAVYLAIIALSALPLLLQLLGRKGAGTPRGHMV